MPYCQCGEVKLYYEVQGEGVSLLLVAGLGGGTWSWYGQAPYFRERYRTIAFDNRGAGRSSMPQGPYRMKQFAEDARCLLDHLGVERALVLGLSMGGMIAQELALLAPHCIMALLLGCTHGGGPSHIPTVPSVLEILLNNGGLDQKEIIEKNLPIFLSKACRREKPEVVVTYCAAQLAAPEQPEYAFHAQLAAISTFDASERLRKIKIPAMIVAGSEDVLIPPENAHVLAKRLPHAEVVVIPGAGHALQAECADMLNAMADRFFRQVALTAGKSSAA
jgi:pimeloyl-ACP methyl ester carboxylesterase